MIIPTSIKLVNSLSGSEKRYFKLYTRKQSGNKDYIFLFDIIDKSKTGDEEIIRKKFSKHHPSASLIHTAKYLVKVLSDCLVQSKTEKDNFFQLLQDIMRIKIWQERALGDESYRKLIRIRQSASESQQYWIEYFTYREELNYLSDSNFQGLPDKLLVETQMKAKDVLKNLNHIHDHHSLFELLKYRLVHSGKISSDEEKKRLNDLMLSEMTLIAGKNKKSFASQKLHLLFQSFFFTDIGDYQSALKVFRALNTLFEQNAKQLDHPPHDYLSALNGILDSLHILKKYDEIGFFVEKIRQLDQAAYPEYFRVHTRKTMAVYQLAVLTGEQKFVEAHQFARSLDQATLRTYSLVSEEKQWELYLYCSLAAFHVKDLRKAHGYIGEVTRENKLQPHLLVCKAIRLLDIIIHYEKRDTAYLEYEIRSYKRFFGKQHPLLKAEKIFLKFITQFPDERRKKVPQVVYKKLEREITTASEDKYEQQLLKYFDFLSWLLKKIHK